MLVQYIRKDSKIVETPKGRMMVGKGPIKGVIIADGPGVVGWSLWNKKAEIEEERDRLASYWEKCGMTKFQAYIKADKRAKTVVKFDKKKAIQLAEGHMDDSLDFMSKVPHSIKPFVDVMVERSDRYYR